MNPSLQATDFLYSQYGSEPEMGELVELFVAEIPAKIAAFESYAATGDWQAIGTMAHQLKGSAGGYGFHQLTVPARCVETAAREAHPEEQILESVKQLVSICRRLRVGAGANVTSRAREK